MNSTSILQSNLLDIVFENRNKDYGAYQLRKFYNNRLGVSVFIMISVVVLFSLFKFLGGSADVPVLKHFVFETRDNNPVNFENKTKAISSSSKENNKKIQKKINGETTPEIVGEKNINKSIASVNDPGASELAGPGNEQLIPGNSVGPGLSTTPAEGMVPAAERKQEKPEILPVAEVMPQYPGGLKALLAYLKKNIQAPGDVEEGKEISVKVKFVVNYNGKLESFVVTESGGAAFDNEVLRVLKKMPLWIPGKSSGENVSVYYTVPVKFTSDF